MENVPPLRGALDASRTRIRTLVDIAARNGRSLPLEDLALLLPEDVAASADDLKRLLREDRVLREELILRDGEVVPRGSERLLDPRMAEADLAPHRLEQARGFADRLMRSCPWIRVVGVSGSLAYGRARRDDDIDFFLIVARDRLWITLLLAMARARAWRRADPEVPVLCFNRLLEEDRADAVFRTRQEPLFAREALNLRPVGGDTFYRALLRRASWMDRYFPRLYRSRSAFGADSDPPRQDGRAIWSLLNRMAFLTLGPYLWLAGLARNRMLRRMGRREALFRTVVRRDFCAYESTKYDELRARYEGGLE